MPRYGNVRAGELRNLLLRMGFVETARNDHWRYRHTGLRLRTFVSFGNNEIDADFMGSIIANQLRMTIDEFRAAMNGDIPARFTNPEFWSN
jgi:predicted RNA binding protein YcfA (HicA-like mRNA interferase family)